MQSPALPDAGNVFFRSDRLGSLRFATLVCAVPVPMTLWLLSLSPVEDWRGNPFGPALWWLIPALLVALSLVLPASMFLLHNRYVMRLERTPAGQLRVTTFLVWGLRTREVASKDLAVGELEEEEGRWDSLWTPSVNAPFLRVRLRAGGQWIFDQQCEAPHGWDALRGLLGFPVVVVVKRRLR